MWSRIFNVSIGFIFSHIIKLYLASETVQVFSTCSIRPRNEAAKKPLHCLAVIDPCSRNKEAHTYLTIFTIVIDHQLNLSFLYLFLVNLVLELVLKLSPIRSLSGLHFPRLPRLLKFVAIWRSRFWTWLCCLTGRIPHPSRPESRDPVAPLSAT